MGIDDRHLPGFRQRNNKVAITGQRLVAIVDETDFEEVVGIVQQRVNLKSAFSVNHQVPLRSVRCFITVGFEKVFNVLAPKDEGLLLLLLVLRSGSQPAGSR